MKLIAAYIGKNKDFKLIKVKEIKREDTSAANTKEERKIKNE